MRLNLFLQKAGIGSRREAERLVAAQRVQINGVVAIATNPVSDGDKVAVDGKIVSVEGRSQPRLFMLNKPLDVLVTAKDKQGRRTIYDLPCLLPPQWGKEMPRVMYVGRLDVNSEGLLLLSTDGSIAQKLMDPKSQLPRVYRVRVHGKLSETDMDRIRKGVFVNGIRYRGAEIYQEEDKGGRTNSWYRVTLYEGKNREIRKLMEHFGCVVNRLIRIQYGPFHLDKLEQGKVVEIKPDRVRKFIATLKTGEKHST
jgi:23S rRNA pseudouridine2605 synthase